MVEAFIIVPPLNPWDRPKERIMLEVGIKSMAMTAGAAWMRHTMGDMSKVQYWHDRGYRLRRVRVELIDEVAGDGE